MPALWQKISGGWGGRFEPVTGLFAQRELYFKRYLYRNYRTFASITHRFGRRITLTGWMVLACTVVSAALGADTNTSLSYQTFALLGSLVIAGAVLTPFGRPKVELERLLPKFGSVGETLRYRIRLRNLGKRPQQGLALMEDLPDPRPTFEQFCETPEPGEERRNWIDRTYGYYRWRWLLGRNIRARVATLAAPDLPPNGDCLLRAELTPLRRGVLRLTGMTIACPDPFGLFRSLLRVSQGQSLLVFPRRYDLPCFELPGTMKYQIGGVSLASSVGESEEFVALREYRPGDPLRRVQWKSFAKLGKPIVKEYQEEFFVRHALVLDTFAGHDSDESFEEAVSVAASLAYTIRNQDSLVDLMFVGARAYCFTTGRGVAHVEQMLEVLASVQHGMGKFESLQDLVMTHAHEMSGCVCVFLKWDDARQRLVEGLLSRRVPLRVFVVASDGGEISPGVMAAHPNHFHVLPLGQMQETLARL